MYFLDVRTASGFRVRKGYERSCSLNCWFKNNKDILH